MARKRRHGDYHDRAYRSKVKAWHRSSNVTMMTLAG
jgi:hypothetical protein